MKIRAAVLNRMGVPTPYAASKPLSITEVDLYLPGRGEFLVKIAAAGLCHSDLSVIDGNRPRPLPMVPRPRGGGRRRGPRPRRGRPHGRRPRRHGFGPSCGHCLPPPRDARRCASQARRRTGNGDSLSGARRIHCDGADVNHHLGCSAFAEYATVARRSLVKIDRELPLDEAALFGCAVMTGVGAVINTARVQAGSSVAVIGLGAWAWPRCSAPSQRGRAA